MTGMHMDVGCYVADALETNERHAFEKHLTDCESCSREVSSSRRHRRSCPDWSPSDRRRRRSEAPCSPRSERSVRCRP